MFIARRFYWLMTLVILVTAAGAFVPGLFTVGRCLLTLLVVAFGADVAMLWSRRGIDAARTMSDRFSNGDANAVRISVESSYPFTVRAEVVDEIPFVFQRRDVSFRTQLAPRGEATIRYELTPTQRGVYGFGRIRVFATTRLGLVERRYTCDAPRDVKVYPSYLMLRQYELLAMSI